MVASLLMMFLIGATGNQEVFTIANSLWVCFAWYAGYQRVKDAGQHGAWAIFTPFVLGLVVIGCLKSKPVDEMLR
jgi:hypothetical protein